MPTIIAAARWARLSCLAIAALAIPAASHAQSVADFYKGKTVSIIVGFSPGGGYDLNARTIGRFIGKHIPGTPTVVVQNMPGAGSLNAANYIANIAAKDGTAVATFSRGVPFEPLMGNKAAQFDPRTLNWIGSPSQETNVVFVSDRTKFQSFDDLKASEMVVATTGAGADTAMFPLIVNGIFKTKLKVITGYPGATETLLAVERGEADGMAGLSWGYLKASRPAWIKEKRVRVLMQLGLAKAPDLPGVVSALDIVSEPADRQLLEFFLARLAIAWPIVAPPNVPADRLAALREAFEKTMADPEYRAEAEKQSLEVAPVSAAAISAILTKVYATDPTALDRARKIVEESR